MIERDDVNGVAVVRMAHGKVNALDVELLTALLDEFTGLAAGDARAVALTGAGPAFSAGVDLKRFTTSGSEYVASFLGVLDNVFEALFTMPQPVVAAVNGHAIAGGCVLACACDRRLMADGAGRIGLPELLVGVPFPTAAFEVMRYAVGTQRLGQLVTSGATLPPHEAEEAGLVDDVVDASELVDRALAEADELSGGRIPAGSYRITKRQLRRPTVEAIHRDRPLDEPDVNATWMAPATTAWIDAYMSRVTGS